MGLQIPQRLLHGTAALSRFSEPSGVSFRGAEAGRDVQKHDHLSHDYRSVSEGKKKARVEGSNEISAPASGISIRRNEKVLTPRHKDLEAGSWTRAHSTRNSIIILGAVSCKANLFTNYSPWPRR